MLKLIERAERFSDRIAIVSDDQTYTHAQLLADSGAAAGALLGREADLDAARPAF